MCLKSNVNFNIERYPIYTILDLADDASIFRLLITTTNYNYDNMPITVVQD